MERNYAKTANWPSFLVRSGTQHFLSLIYRNRYRCIDIGVGIDVGTVQISYNPRGTQVINPNSIETTEHLYDNHRPSSFSSSDVGAEPTPVSWVLITKTANLDLSITYLVYFNIWLQQVRCYSPDACKTRSNRPRSFTDKNPEAPKRGRFSDKQRFHVSILACLEHHQPYKSKKNASFRHSMVRITTGLGM